MMPRKARHVVLVALPGFQLIDIAGPADVFDATQKSRALAGQRGSYELTIAGPTRSVRSGCGIAIECTRFEDVARPIDTVIIAGAIEFAVRVWTPGELQPVRKLLRGARRIGSVCAGAFVLQALGELKGHRATTHWLCVDALRRRDASVNVESDAIYVQDGRVFTSAGASTGIDLALALVADDYGHDAALTVARLLVVYLHRPGGQSQFSAATSTRQPRQDPIRRIQGEIVDDPGGDHRVEELAHRASMSSRNFSRVFVNQTGVSPARFVRDVRIEAARHQLELGDEDLQAVADRVGLGSAETLRRVFVAKLGIPPGAYRQRFHDQRGPGG